MRIALARIRLFGDIKRPDRICIKDQGAVSQWINRFRLEEAEEAFFHAVENVEGAIIHAIDDEVEMLFPHHQKSVDE